VFKAHRLCVSLNSRLESNKEEDYIAGLRSSRSSSVCLLSGFGFRVSGFGFRVSGFGFRVSGFGFRVSAFGFRV